MAQLMASVQLYSYQREAVDRMKNGCILCGGVGSGKSRTSLAYYYKLYGGNLDTTKYKKMIDPEDLYIITTAQKRDKLEWESELSYFLLSTHPEVNLYSNKVVVDSWNNIKKYAEVKKSFFIFDEQRLIGSGVWVKTFLKIAKVNQWVLLSATPGDKWEDYIPIFIANGFYRNRTDFIGEHIVYSSYTRFRKVDHYVNTKKLIRHRNDILITMDYERPTTSHHKDVYVDYDAALYKKVTRTRWNPYTNLPITSASELYFVWRKIVNESESRQVALLEIVEKHPRVIIFYNFDYELDILRGLRYGEGFEIAEWNGHLHQPLPAGEKWVYLVQYNAGAEGWNCVTTDTMIFYSQNYSYRISVQASGRIDRLNTKYVDLYYYHLKSHAWIDLAIARSLNAKKNFNESKYDLGFPKKIKRKNSNSQKLHTPL